MEALSALMSLRKVESTGYLYTPLMMTSNTER